MNEIHLERSEFLALLAAVHARFIVGIAREKLFPADAKERRTVLQQGMTLLARRGLLQSEDNQPDATLLKLARIVAYPQIAFVIIRHVQKLGPQLFLLYQSQEGIVEQTFPTAGMHRLAVLSDIPLLLTRAAQILSLPEHLSQRNSIELAQEDFFQCNDLAQHNQPERALELLKQKGIPLPEADALVTVLHESDFRGEVTLLKCRQETIVDARDIAVIQDQKMAWSATQIVAGEPLLRIESVNALIVQSQISHCFVELVQANT
jgi:hypothetical protein